MIAIVWMLFVAWFLGLFGLDDLFINAIGITHTMYYFIFAIAGLIKNILMTINKNATVELNADDVDELKNIFKKDKK